jgi:outer membrane protein TolC
MRVPPAGCFVVRIVVVMLSIATFVTATLRAQQVLTLAQAVTEALQRNDRMLNQQDSIEQAQLGTRLARNEFQPKIVPNVLGSFGRTDINSQTYRVDATQKFTTGTVLSVGTGTSTAQIPATPGTAGEDVHFYNADTTFTLTQPLLRGFGTSVARRPFELAEFRQADANRARTTAEQQLAIDVASAYYRVVAQQAFLVVAKQSLERSRKLRDAAESKLTAGLVSQLDVLRAQDLISQAQLQFFDAESAVDDARDRLSFLINRERTDRFEVDPEIPKPDDQPIDAAAAIATALQSRPDIQGFEAAVADADHQIAFARNQLLPQFDVNVNYTRRQTADTFLHSFGVDGFKLATFFTVATPIDRTPQLVAYQNAVLDANRRHRDLDTTRRQVSDDVRHAIRERDRLVRSLAAAEMSVDICKKEVEVAQLRYERGLSNNLDVVAAETALLNTESRRIGVLAESAIAQLTIRAVLGILDPRKDFSATPRAGNAEY